MLTVRMGGSGGYSGYGWVCNGCIYFVGWLEWCLEECGCVVE